MNPTCAIVDCVKPARSGSATLCPMHYHREYRHGDTSKTATRVQTGAGRRYVRQYIPSHPLATKNGTQYVHRIVLFDAIGAGSHPCHWCGVTLHWRPTEGQHRLDVDHLDGIGDNNKIENLVPTCTRCNVGRGAVARHAGLLAAGWWSRHDTIDRLGARNDQDRFSAA